MIDQENPTEILIEAIYNGIVEIPGWKSFLAHARFRPVRFSFLEHVLKDSVRRLPVDPETKRRAPLDATGSCTIPQG